MYAIRSYYGCRYAGLTDDKAHFLDLPFYETGTVKKNPVGPEDVRIIKELLVKIKPHVASVAPAMNFNGNGVCPGVQVWCNVKL